MTCMYQERSAAPGPQHTCCGARISIGAYGDWHLCEGCEAALARRHAERRHAALDAPAIASAPGGFVDRYAWMATAGSPAAFL